MSSLADRRRLLVSAARSDGPSVADRERIRLALAAQLGGGAPPDGGPSASSASAATGPGPSASCEVPAAAKAGAAASSGLTGMLGAIGAASVAALAVAAFLTLRPLGPSGAASLGAVEPGSGERPRSGGSARPDETRLPGESARAGDRRPAEEPTEIEKAPEPTASASSRAVPPEAARAPAPSVPRSPAAHRGASLEPSGSRASAGGLAEEVELLRRARDATREGDGARALAVLDDLERRQPDGVLGEERRASRIVALCASDRAAEGRAEASTFLAEMPSSIHADRVRAACRGPR